MNFIAIHTHRYGTDVRRVIADHHITDEEYAAFINKKEGEGTVELERIDEFVMIHSLRDLDTVFMK